MSQGPKPGGGHNWVAIYLIGVLLAAFLAMVAGADSTAAPDDPQRGGQRAPGIGGFEPREPLAPRPSLPPEVEFDSAPDLAPDLGPDPGPDRVDQADAEPRALPDGGTRIFHRGNVLVAYYGTAGSGALGVLGEQPPDRIMARLRAAARPFGRGGREVQPVFELIATVAHAGPTRTGSYSSDIDHRAVARYIRAAHRHSVLLILDLQPGRADFLRVAKRWAWALADPWVGLALDPEWRMGPHGVPGQRIGSVGALEVNRVSAWLDDLTARRELPEKVFMVHQFRSDMIRNIDRIRSRDNLALVQHVDGFGTPQQKRATFHHVVRPRLFHPGFKLFYDEDIRRMSAPQVLALRPRVRFVSFQ